MRSMPLVLRILPSILPYMDKPCTNDIHCGSHGYIFRHCNDVYIISGASAALACKLQPLFNVCDSMFQRQENDSPLSHTNPAGHTPCSPLFHPMGKEKISATACAHL